jgi:tetraprenyl-beta-curcumene synthase
VSAANAIAVFEALVVYERQIVPLVRSELRRWEAQAEAVPDPVLRAAAVSSLKEKGRNAEATAVFAILAPRAGRRETAQAIVALQAAIDYLDTLGEQPGDDPLADGLALHGAVCDAVSSGGANGDWYSRHPRGEDGGYLAALVAECRQRLAGLPAIEAMRPQLQSAARRCGEGQSHTHAAGANDGGELKTWAAQLEAGPGYLWWELAAGAGSSVAIHALIAAAADPATTPEEAVLIDAAYFPSIGALTVLLDDLVDRDEDLGSHQHNYLSYCASPEEAANRIGLLADRARAATTRLRRARRHYAILAGVAAFYMSADTAAGEYARPIRGRLLESLDPTVRMIMGAMRLRRHA